jgi:UDP-glucose 4-epimerase
VKVVVTGGAGFIGANLCRALDADDAMEVVALDDLSTGSRENLKPATRTELVEGSILDAGLVHEVVRGAAAVVHLAARPSVSRSIEDPIATHEVNATGTLRVLEAARAAGVPHVVLASSSSVYGNSAVLPKREDMPVAPRSPYAASKLATESYALSYAAVFDLKVLALRFFNVFGPLQTAGHAYAAVIPAFVSAALAGRPLPMQGDGTQTRDFTFVGSVVGIVRRALAGQVHSPTPVNLAFGTRQSLNELVQTLEQVIGRPLDVDRGPERPGDVKHSQADTTALRGLFPGAEPVDFADGLRQTVEWFQSLTDGPPTVGRQR